MHRLLSALTTSLLLTQSLSAQGLDDLAASQARLVETGVLQVLGEPLRGHGDVIVDVALSADGRRCLTASWDGTAKIWNLVTPEPPVVLRGHEGPLSFAGFVGASDLVLTAATDETLRIWDGNTGAELRNTSLDAVHQAGAVSPDGGRLASADQRSDAVEIRDIETLEVVQRVPFEGSMQTCYAWSSDGRYLVVGGTLRPKVVVWDTRAGKVVSELATPTGAVSLAVRHDDHALAVGGYDMIATFPFPETGEDPSDYVSGTESSVRGIAWRDSRTVIFGDDDGSVVCLDLEGPAMIWSTSEHRDVVQGLAMAPDRSFVASASHDETLRFWKVDDGTEVLQTAGSRDMVLALAWNPDGDTLVAGDYGNVVTVYGTSSGAVRSRRLDHEFSVVAVAVVEGRGLVSAGQDDAFCWSPLDGGPEVDRFALEGEDIPMLMAGSFRGTRFAGAFGDGSLRLYTADDGGEATVIEAHAGPAHDVAWSAEGDLLASSGDDGAVKLFRADGGAVATLAEDLEHENEVCFAGRHVVAGDAGGTVRIWDADTRELRHEFSVAVIDDEAVQEVCASPDGARLATLTANRVAVWSVATAELLVATEDYLSIPTFAAFSPDGARLATGMVDSTVLVWDLAKLADD